MGRFGPMEFIIIAAVVLILFGRGKVSSLMGEVGKGITAFKRGVKDEAADVVARDVTPDTTKVPEQDKV
ncbi:MAG: twin-arginine translocase TatA/TatE family subunit [Rhodobacteraceae bacterium]|nr:twin-arginine translocase TatA/TatE family subunit [Paracoccaceae bacterium]